jgi:hypothetical protein
LLAAHIGLMDSRQAFSFPAMGKAKTAATGGGYVGEILVHKISRQIGVVEAVREAQAGWPPEISLKLKDGSIKKGKLSDFKEVSREQKKKFNGSP